VADTTENPTLVLGMNKNGLEGLNSKTVLLKTAVTKNNK